jgi:hypothetical protein
VEEWLQAQDRPVNFRNPMLTSVTSGWWCYNSVQEKLSRYCYADTRGRENIKPRCSWHWPKPLFTPGKGPRLYLLDRRLGGPFVLVWTKRLEDKSCVSAEKRTPVVQSVLRHYSNWSAILIFYFWKIRTIWRIVKYADFNWVLTSHVRV